MTEFLSTLLKYAIEFGKDLLVAIIVAVAGKLLIDFAMKLYAKSNQSGKLDVTVHLFIGNMLKFTLYALLALIVVDILGLPTASLLTAVGSVGVAVGLALQGSLSNFAGGIMLLIFKPFKVGDVIDSNGIVGTVDSITLFYTYVITPDNRRVCVPNGGLSNSVITNNSANAERRVDMQLSVAYDSDIDLVKDTLQVLAKNHPSVIVEKGIHTRVGDYADSAILVDWRVWCKKEDYFAVKADLLEQANEAFKIREIEVPFNQLEVTIKK
jgi:small conductance mechanosensitive channel